MGTDAEIVSRNKRLGCYIDRKYNVDIDDLCTYDELEAGVSTQRAKEILNHIITDAPNRERIDVYWTKAALAFVETLSDDDTVLLRDEHTDGYMDYEMAPEPTK